MLQRPFLTESEFKHEFLNFWAKMVTIHVERVHKEDRYDALCLLKEFMDDTTDEQFPSVYEAKFWSQKIQKKIDQLGWKGERVQDATDVKEFQLLINKIFFVFLNGQ